MRTNVTQANKTADFSSTWTQTSEAPTLAVAPAKVILCGPAPHVLFLLLSSHPAGFALQAYRGAQKPTAMEVMKSQATRLAEDGAAQKMAPPKMEIPTVAGRSRGAKAHKLKPRDMNILTPSGF